MDIELIISTFIQNVIIVRSFRSLEKYDSQWKLRMN